MVASLSIFLIILHTVLSTCPTPTNPWAAGQVPTAAELAAWDLCFGGVSQCIDQRCANILPTTTASSLPTTTVALQNYIINTTCTYMEWYLCYASCWYVQECTSWLNWGESYCCEFQKEYETLIADGYTCPSLSSFNIVPGSCAGYVPRPPAPRRRVICNSYGEPHITTFDGASINTDDSGDWLLFADKATSPSIIISQRHEPCHDGDTSAACIRGLALKISGYTLEFLISVNNGNNTVQYLLDGVSQFTGYPSENGFDTVFVGALATPLSGVTITGKNDHIIINCTSALSLPSDFIVNLRPWIAGATVFIKTQSQNFPSGSVIGLCGDLNGRGDDDAAAIAGWGTGLKTGGIGSRKRASLVSSPFTTTPVEPVGWTPISFTSTPLRNGMTQNQATTACASLAVSTDAYNQCIFDVGATGDLQAAVMAQQDFSASCAETCDPSVTHVVPPPSQFDYSVCGCPQLAPTGVWYAFSVTGGAQGMTLTSSCVKTQLEAACQLDQPSCTVTSINVIDMSGGEFDISFTTSAYFSRTRIASVTFPSTSPCWEQIVLRSWACTTAADCPNSAPCVGGYCDVQSSTLTTAQCDTSADCAEPLVCRQGECVQCGAPCAGSTFSLF